MNVVILTPEKEVFKGDATSVKVPSLGGEFEVLNNHAPVVSALGSGNVRVLTGEGDRLVYHINSGFVKVLSNEVSILVQGLQEE